MKFYEALIPLLTSGTNYTISVKQIVKGVEGPTSTVDVTTSNFANFHVAVIILVQLCFFLGVLEPAPVSNLTASYDSLYQVFVRYNSPEGNTDSFM